MPKLFPAGAAEILHRLIDCIVLPPTDDGLVVELHGDLAPILTFSDEARGGKARHRPVSVINLVTEDSIEQWILHLMSQKQGLAGDSGAAAPRVEVLERSGFSALRRLAEAGIVSFASEARLTRARALYTNAERKLRMAALLAGGGFAVEARAPLQDAVAGAANSVVVPSNGDAAWDRWDQWHSGL